MVGAPKRTVASPTRVMRTATEATIWAMTDAWRRGRKIRRWMISPRITVITRAMIRAAADPTLFPSVTVPTGKTSFPLVRRAANT
jgi:hypothetical protein